MTTQDVPTLPRHWFGYLTLENAEQVADAIRRMLDGKRYTWVAVNENLDLLHPEVRTGQYLDAGKATNGDAVTLRTRRLGDETPYAHITVVDSYGVWGVSTTCPDQKTAYSRVKENGAVGLHHMADPDLEKRGDYDIVYLSFEREGPLRIQQRTTAGGRISWTIAVEDTHVDHEMVERGAEEVRGALKQYENGTIGAIQPGSLAQDVIYAALGR